MIICGLDLSMNGSGLFKLFLDDNLNIVDTDYMAFCSVKKHANDKVIYFKKNDYKDRYAINLWMCDKIKNFVKDSSYIAIEDYAFGASGNNFDIGEFIGYIKTYLYNDDYKIRLYDPNSIKKFATGKGNSDKVSMYLSFKQSEPNLLNDLPIVNKGGGVSPSSDIIDAYWISQLLLTELKLRKGLILLSSLDENVISIFNRCTKSNPVNILDRDFLEK